MKDFTKKLNTPEVSAPATTTVEDDLRTKGQRKINLIWEVTQAVIAIAVTVTTLFVTGYIVVASLLRQVEGWEAAFLLLSNAFFVVISTYLARTNHTKVGGVGVGKSGDEHRGE